MKAKAPKKIKIKAKQEDKQRYYDLIKDAMEKSLFHTKRQLEMSINNYSNVSLYEGIDEIVGLKRRDIKKVRRD